MDFGILSVLEGFISVFTIRTDYYECAFLELQF